MPSASAGVPECRVRVLGAGVLKCLRAELVLCSSLEPSLRHVVGCVPAMKVSLIVFSPADGTPVALSTDTTTMLPGAGNSGLGSRPRNSRRAFITSIQIGSAAVVPVSPRPSDFFSSKPIQTPIVISGSKPMNHASV